MRQMAIRFGFVLVVAATVMGFGSEAEANKLDISAARFINCDAVGNCAADVAEYEKFLMEYSFGLAPKILAPAETLGYSGFYLGLEGSITPRPGTKGSVDRWKKGTAPESEYPDVMFLPTVHIRKGLPWSFEVGGTISYLAQSELVGLGGEIKWSLFEGYRHDFRGALPDIAARGSVVRILGESDLDMTIIGVDGSISYPFGIGGMVVLTPYAGFQYLWTLVRVEPLLYYDKDADLYRPEGNDPITGRPTWSTTGLSGPNLGRAKLFMGFRFSYEVLTFVFDLGWGLKKDWETEEDDNSEEVNVVDQIQISGGVGMDF